MSPVLLFLLGLATVFGLDSCRWAYKYDPIMVQTDQATRDLFVADMARYESNFMAGGVGSNAVNGMTYDGRPLNYTTGEITSENWAFSAPSKESVHMGYLAYVLAGDSRVSDLMTPDEAVDILERKIQAIEDFDKNFPGFGGFLPWFDVTDAGISPTWDFEDRVPSLDNGEMIWGIIGIIQALSDTGYLDLADRYDQYLQKLALNARTVFWDGDGQVRAVSNIVNTSAQPTPSNYYTTPYCGDPCYLDDPYEGELFVWFMDLFCQWDDPSEKEDMWVLKRKKLQKVEFSTPSDGTISVTRGWWFSAHEQWKYLMMPYQKIKIAERVFLNGERARTWNSVINGIPGLYASVTEPSAPSVQPPTFAYISDCGIPSIAFEPVTHLQVVTPYAAFPVILADQGIGLSWYQTMLLGPAMQSNYGSTESIDIDGTAICPCMTWDSKITTLVAALGGVGPFTEKYMRAHTGMWERFEFITQREFWRVFSSLNGETLDLLPPASSLPMDVPDFSTCSI
ncbi:GPI anchored protein [Pelomyxa schiedti]|nr:GPI anchored protein [Pelomyxa schiedti]